MVSLSKSRELDETLPKARAAPDGLEDAVEEEAGKTLPAEVRRGAGGADGANFDGPTGTACADFAEELLLAERRCTGNEGGLMSMVSRRPDVDQCSASILAAFFVSASEQVWATVFTSSRIGATSSLS